MAAIIGLSIARALGFDLEAAVQSFRQQVEDHALTVDVPAPTAHPVVEQIVRFHGGEFVIEDDTPPVLPAEHRAALSAAVSDGLHARLSAICSPARRNLAQLDRAEILAKIDEDRTPAEVERLAEIALVDLKSRAIQRHAALLQIEIEDLPDDQLDGWEPHGWPA